MGAISTVSVSVVDITSPLGPVPATISDENSSELIEAVASLNVSHSSPPRKGLSKTSMRVENIGEIDSGYASKNASQASTPDSSKFIEGGGVVCSTPRWPITGRKKIKLMHFESPVSLLTQNRFEDLRELHADNLAKLTRGVSKCRGILMSLKVLGATEATAAPWVFIQCDKAIAKKVRRFFKQRSVESDFKPLVPDAYTPSFEIYVHEMPPLALGSTPPDFSTPQFDSTHHALESVGLYLDKNAMIRDNSLCGSKITAVTAGGQRSSATIGGLILIETKQGDFHTLGMTAGHFLAPNHDLQTFEEDGEEGEVDDDSNDGFFDDEQEYELELSSLGCEGQTSSAETTPLNEWPENTGVSIGKIYRTSQDSRQDGLNLDWALFTIENSSLYLPNIVAAREVTRAIHQKPMETERGVVLSTATSGLLYGKLSNSSSYLMLAPGNGMAKTYSLIIFNNQSKFVSLISMICGILTWKELTAGDSGAWVVDPVTNELYGHVVASDVFGIAYVVPIEDIFKAIKIQLSLQTIRLRTFTGGETLTISKEPTKSGLGIDNSKYQVKSYDSPPPLYSSFYNAPSLDSAISPAVQLLWPNSSKRPSVLSYDSGYSSLTSTPPSATRSSPDQPLTSDFDPFQFGSSSKHTPVKRPDNEQTGNEQPRDGQALLHNMRLKMGQWARWTSRKTESGKDQIKTSERAMGDGI
jgi:hypothetical protein